MSARNPFLTLDDRAPHHFAELMRMLPETFSAAAPPTADQRLQIAAAAQHAEDGNRVLMDGLAVVGQLLFIAASNSSLPLEPTSLADLGLLVRHMAVEAHYLQGERDELLYSLTEDDGRIAAAPAPAPGPKKRGDK